MGKHRKRYDEDTESFFIEDLNYGEALSRELGDYSGNDNNNGEGSETSKA